MNPEKHLSVMLTVNPTIIKKVISYILLNLNDKHFLNPQLSQGELFDLYEEIMMEYKVVHGGNFDTSEPAKNMREFFKAENDLDKNTIQTIDMMLQSENFKNISKNLQAENESIQLYCDSEDKGKIWLYVPINPSVINTSHLTEVSETIESKMDNKAYGELEQHTSYESPDLTFQKMLIDVTEEADQNPTRYLSIINRLNGLNAHQINHCHEQIIITIDILRRTSLHGEIPTWKDVVSFIYGIDLDALDLLTDYILEQHELLIDGEIEEIPAYEAILSLQRYFVSQYAKVPKPLDYEGQWLVAFVDLIKETYTNIEEADKR